MRVGIAGQAIEGDREPMRDLYAVAGQRWVDEGLTEHDVFVPSHDAELVDAWFRLSFGASAVLAMRETEPTAEEPFDGDVTIRRGTPEDFDEAARLDLDMTEALRVAPSFSKLPLQTQAELATEWREELGEHDELFVAERDGRIVGLLLLYRRPPDLRVAPNSHRPRAGLDRAGGSRHRRRPRADRARDRLGPRQRLPGDDDRLADDEPLGLALLAQARLSTGVPARVPVDPVVQRVPLLFGTRLTVVDAPEDAVVLRPPPPGEPVADVRAAVRDALRFPLAGDPLEALVTRGGRATIVVEPPALPLPGALNDPRQEALAAASAELERAGVPTERQTLLVATGLTRRPQRRELERLGVVSPGFARRFHGTVEIHDAESPELVELEPAGTHAAGRPPGARRHRPGGDRQRRGDRARRRAGAAARLRRRRGNAGGDRLLAARDRRLPGLAARDAARATTGRPRPGRSAPRSCSTSRAWAAPPAVTRTSRKRSSGSPARRSCAVSACSPASPATA